MAQHDVTFTIPERALGKADLEFRVNRDGDMVGRLKVSNGSVAWVPKTHNMATSSVGLSLTS